MASILLLGPARFTDAFPRAGEHRWHSFDPASDGDLPDADFDAVVDCSLDEIDAADSLDAALDRLSPDGIIVVNVLTRSATDAAAMLEGNRALFGIALLPGVERSSLLLEVSIAMQSDDAARDRGLELLREITGCELEQVEDRLALVGARILAMVINEATFALMEGVAGADDIDTAMKLGTNYPVGPLAWCDAIGADVIVAVLEALHAEYGEERYRPSVLLRRHATAHHPFSTPIQPATQ